MLKLKERNLEEARHALNSSYIQPEGVLALENVPWTGDLALHVKPLLMTLASLIGTLI